MTNIELRNIIIGSKDYEEEFVRDQLSVILEERFEREREEKGMDDLRVVYVKVKGEQEMVNAVIDTGAQMPVVRPDVVEGQSINNRGSIQIMSAFGEHEMGEVKDSNMELNDFRHGVVPVSKNLVNDIIFCSSDYEVLIEKLANDSQSCETSRTFKERRNY
ncbi:hypothetical protein TNCV_4999471 [Trichonephila clavipes]|nr:hypothetical protein TNCV_4999471 [Trichonephila clavipes]